MEGKFQEHTRKDVQEKYADEFDFESMNKKIKELFKAKEEDLSIGSGYDKGKSFFDSISRSKDEKTETPYDRHKQREIDAATFDFDPEYRERRGYYPRYRRGYKLLKLTGLPGRLIVALFEHSSVVERMKSPAGQIYPGESKRDINQNNQ